MSIKASASIPAQIALWCLVALIAFMPFHAFATTWAGSVFGQRTIWQSWKEILIALLCLYSLFWLIRDRRLTHYILHYRLNQIIVGYAGLHLLVTAIAQVDTTALLHGLKIDLSFLALFIAAQIIVYRAKNPNAERILGKLIIGGGVIVGLFGVAQAWLLPKDILLNFGYGPGVINPYLPIADSSPLFRILSTLGGPNQLGQYLILPIMVLGSYIWHSKKWWLIVLSLPMLICEFYTYSRAAWAALVLAGLVLLWRTAGAKVAALSLMVLGLVFAGGWYAYSQVKHQNPNLNYIVHHGINNEQSISNNQHLSATKAAMNNIADNPLGAGTGSAGPAVFYSKAPSGKISENYFLQIGIEVGIPGLLLFIVIIAVVAYVLWQKPPSHFLASGLLATLAGWTLINIFSHGWADSTAAIMWWGSAGAIIRRSK